MSQLFVFQINIEFCKTKPQKKYFLFKINIFLLNLSF